MGLTISVCHVTNSTLHQAHSYVLMRLSMLYLGSHSQIRSQSGFLIRARRSVPLFRLNHGCQLICGKMFLLDTLDSMPCLRVSDALMQVFLWILKESGASDVPSLGQLRQVQATLRDSSGVPSNLHKPARNNMFYMNDIRSIIAKVCHHP